VAVQADLLDAQDRRRLIDEVHSSLGEVSILVNNAAFTAPGRPAHPAAPPEIASAPPASADWPTFMTTPVRAFRRHFEFVHAAYELMQAFVPDMIHLGGGAIVNISSGASRMPGEGPYSSESDDAIPGYGTSKLALEHLTQCAARELQDRDIAINAVCPSRAIRTPGLEFFSATWDEYSSEEDFAEAVVRLCLVPSSEVTGRVMGHDDVLNGSFASYRHTLERARRPLFETASRPSRRPLC
jgi:NAD(P)-dependent dehydrogenase (short-subunit alcohol dehydrogenase family)